MPSARRRWRVCVSRSAARRSWYAASAAYASRSRRTHRSAARASIPSHAASTASARTSSEAGSDEGADGGADAAGPRARARDDDEDACDDDAYDGGGPSVVGGTAGCLAARAPASAPNGGRADARSAPSASARASPIPDRARAPLDSTRREGAECAPLARGARGRRRRNQILCTAAATQARDEEAPLLRGASHSTRLDSTRKQTPVSLRFRASESHRSSKQTSVSSVRFRPGESGSVRHRSA